MANRLNRTIEVGEVVVISKKYIPDPIRNRLFRCFAGVGMKSFTMGSAISGEWLDGAGRDRIEGYMISPRETSRLVLTDDGYVVE